MSDPVRFSYTLRGPSPAELAQFEANILPMFAPALDRLATGFHAKTQQSFDIEHGKSGDTALGATVEPAVPNPYEIRSTVRFGSHVGFVIKPLPAHKITAVNAAVLFNPGQNLRYQNTYSPFGPARSVNWYQGGNESYAPDRSWYTRHEPALQVEGAIALDRFGAALAAHLAAQRSWVLSYSVEGPQTPGVYAP